jgi:hypothetical protein
MGSSGQVNRKRRRWEGQGAQRLGLPCLLLLSFCCFLFAAAPASAATAHVDGISDQSIPSWDGGFSGSSFSSYFTNHWATGSHVHYARYVVQWNVMSGSGEPYGSYRQRFEEWLNDAASMGLTLDVALTNYPSTPQPSSSAEYKTRMREVLNQAIAQGHPIAYIEPWNEPNNQGNETAVAAGHFANEANTACHEVSPNCTVVAGNVEDKSGVKEYVQSYRGALNFNPVYWGVHPYYSVEYMSTSYYHNFLEGLVNEGAGYRIWFTEVAARRCKPGGENGEAGQASRASYLVNTLMPSAQAEHVFYYEFLLGNNGHPSCGEYDGALYVPSEGDPYAQDRPRPAASYIFGNAATPQGFTGAASTNPSGRQAALSASVYPLNYGESHFNFEYGTSASYGSSSSEGSSGFGLGPSVISKEITGLTPNTTYHYRVHTWNANGSEYGVDKTFTTPAVPPTVSTSEATAITETQVTLNGSVNPNNSDTHYYFEYGTTTAYGGTTPAPPGNDVGSGVSPVPVSATATGLQPGMTYHYRISASNAGGTERGTDRTLTTPAPAAAVAEVGNPNTQFVASEGTNHALYVAVDANGTWSGPFQETSPNTVYSAPSASSDSFGDIFWTFEGANNTFQVLTRIPETKEHPAKVEGPFQLAGAGSALSSVSSGVGPGGVLYWSYQGANHTFQVLVRMPETSEHPAKVEGPFQEFGPGTTYSAPATAPMDSKGNFFWVFPSSAQALQVAVRLTTGEVSPIQQIGGSGTDN